MNQQLSDASGLKVRCDLRSGAIVCFDNSYGYLMPVVTACSTGVYNPYPVTYPPVVNPDPGVQWLSCQQCSGTRVGTGKLSDATCNICYT